MPFSPCPPHFSEPPPLCLCPQPCLSRGKRRPLLRSAASRPRAGRVGKVLHGADPGLGCRGSQTPPDPRSPTDPPGDSIWCAPSYSLPLVPRTRAVHPTCPSPPFLGSLSHWGLQKPQGCSLLGPCTSGHDPGHTLPSGQATSCLGDRGITGPARPDRCLREGRMDRGIPGQETGQLCHHPGLLAVQCPRPVEATDAPAPGGGVHTVSAALEVLHGHH